MARNQGRRNQNRQPRRRNLSDIERSATRDIRISQEPQISFLDRARTGTETAYGGLTGEIEEQRPYFRESSRDIRQNLENQMNRLAVHLQGSPTIPGLPEEEIAAATGLFGGVGEAGLSSLANQRQRQLGYESSALREGGLAQRAALDNLTMMQNEILQGRDELIRQRMDELEEQALARRMALSGIRSDRAFAELIAQLAGRQLSSSRRRRGGGRDGGQGGGGGGGGGYNPSGHTPVWQTGGGF